MFEPPRCPNSECPQHTRPNGRFFVRRGYYKPLCRPHPVPRFRCRSCSRGFSRQTFRSDYCDHKPDRNQAVMQLLCSGIGIRQSARIVGLSLSSFDAKFRKIARNLGRMNANLRESLGGAAVLQFDELETYEGRRNTRPLTLPILIEPNSRFHIEAVCAPIRPSGKMSERRKKAIREDEIRFGRRQDQSAGAIRRVLAAGAAMCTEATSIVFQSDEKTTYPKLARAAFGKQRLVHQTTSSTLPRGTFNPLFPINHTEAMARDLMGRLRRESWLVSKLGQCLDLHLQIYSAFRNFVRRRFNHDQKTPAQILGFVHQPMKFGHLTSWRQDWGADSVHPLATDEPFSIAEYRLRRA